METPPKSILNCTEITAVIVEDVLDDIISLKIILEKDFPLVKIVGTAQSHQAGTGIIVKTRPMVVFVDIKLGGDFEAFDVIDKVYSCGYTAFVPVFITGYGSTDYETRAIDFTGGLYFNKPMDSQKIQAALKEPFAKLIANTFDYQESVSMYMHMIQQLKDGIAPKTDCIKTIDNQLEIIDLTKLKYIKAHGQKAHLHLENGEVVIANNLLKYFDDKYTQDHEDRYAQKPAYDFFRIHKQTLVNLAFMKGFSFNKKLLKLKNGEDLIVSAKESKALKKYLNDMGIDTGERWWNSLF